MGDSRMGRWVRWVLCRWLDGASPASQPYLHAPRGPKPPAEGKVLVRLSVLTAEEFVLFPHQYCFSSFGDFVLAPRTSVFLRVVLEETSAIWQ